jgi:hypothetical protein
MQHHLEQKNMGLQLTQSAYIARIYLQKTLSVIETNNMPEVTLSDKHFVLLALKTQAQT